MQEEAILTLTTPQLMTYITIINAVFMILVAIISYIGYRAVNARITRMNIRISDTQSGIADRSIILAQSLSDLAQSLSNAGMRPRAGAASEVKQKVAETSPVRKDDVVVPLSTDKRA